MFDSSMVNEPSGFESLKFYCISILFWYSGVLYISQVLKVTRNVENGIFLHILSNVSANAILGGSVGTVGCMSDW